MSKPNPTEWVFMARIRCTSVEAAHREQTSTPVSSPTWTSRATLLQVGGELSLGLPRALTLAWTGLSTGKSTQCSLNKRRTTTNCEQVQRRRSVLDIHSIRRHLHLPRHEARNLHDEVLPGRIRCGRNLRHCICRLSHDKEHLRLSPDRNNNLQNRRMGWPVSSLPSSICILS